MWHHGAVKTTEAPEAQLPAGRDAVARRAWPEAYGALRPAWASGRLDADDLELFAKAAWWVGRPAEAIEAWERAYGKHVERDEKLRAALVAITLRRQYGAKLAKSVARGWLNRAERLVGGEPESVVHGYVAIAHAQLAWSRGELDHALSHLEAAAAVAERLGEAKLRAWAAMYRGMVLVDLGRVDEGWALLEDVSAAAVGNELGAYTTGVVFCNVINVCRDLADYGRASEWAEAATRWCERQSINGFPGICRVHRAEIMRLLGTWAEAESELRRATDELYDFSPMHAASAFHELGEIHFRMGDEAAAEHAFSQAQEIGEDPQPGRALLLLRQGKVDAAAASIRGSLAEETWNRLSRARLLPAQAEIAWAGGDSKTAAAAAQELDGIAADYPADAIVASVEWAHGFADLADRAPSSASKRFRKARQLWRQIDAPYETARAGMLLGAALAADGDVDGAVLELETARTAFDRLGAVPDVRVAADRLAELQPAVGREVAQRTFMFTDIVGSTALLEAIGDEAWGDLRRWHDETLRGCIANHRGEEVDHTGDGFFAAFPDAASAVACAREIQTRLTEHRRDHGFAPQVRIGVHAADATRAGRNYSGRGVHAAARIGAIGGAGEIVASASTVEPLTGVQVSNPRSVALKGIAEPVDVVTVDWR
jgi:class 3 adenylate cyclase